ncbi:MAG: hypothetical protein J6V66_03020 [Clostridia bacterium]|nr:hypothetical protein [Clostridia bacterium]
MILAKNEIILNEWEYATSNKYNRFFKKTNHILTVTNKRLVSNVSNKRGVARREVAIESIQNMSLIHEKPFVLGSIFRLLIALILIGGGIFAMVSFPNVYVIVAASIAVLIGIAVLLDALFDLGQGYFYIELSTNNVGESSVMSVGFEKYRRKLSVKKRLRINVDNDMARDIADKLGAIIFEYK